MLFAALTPMPSCKFQVPVYLSDIYKTLVSFLKDHLVNYFKVKQ